MKYAILILVLAANCLSQEKKSTVLFGVTLGRPFPYSVHQCTRGFPADTTPCWEIGLMKERPPNLVNIPYEHARISLTSNNHQSDGPISSITTVIAEPYCGDSIQKLLSKFGKPDSDEKVPMQNGFGAEWNARLVKWITKDDVGSEIEVSWDVSSPTAGCLLQATTKTWRDASDNQSPKLSNF